MLSWRVGLILKTAGEGSASSLHQVLASGAAVRSASSEAAPPAGAEKVRNARGLQVEAPGGVLSGPEAGSRGDKTLRS